SESGGPSTTARSGPQHRPRDCDVNTLSPNGLHVLANDLQVPGPHVAEIGSGDEHLATETEGEVRLVLEDDGEEQRPVLNGMADVVYNPAVDFDIALAKLLAALLDTLVNLPVFLVGDRSNGRAPDPHDLRFARLAFLRHGSSSPALHSWRSQWAAGACWGAVCSALAPPLCVFLRWLLLNRGQCRYVAAIPASCVLPRAARHRYTRRQGLATFFHRRVSASRNDLHLGVPDRPVLRRNQRSRRRGLLRSPLGLTAMTPCRHRRASPCLARS